MTKKPLHSSQPDCSYCGGLHYGTPRNECVYQCKRCGLDTRDDAEGFGHKKCQCTPLPQEAKQPATATPEPSVITHAEVRHFKGEWCSICDAAGTSRPAPIAATPAQPTALAGCPMCGSWSRKQIFCSVRHDKEPVYNLAHVMQLPECRPCVHPWHMEEAPAQPADPKDGG